MHVLVLGSGIIGVTHAYYLAKKGVKVTVIDRQDDCAMETSFANAGQISPGYSAPWAGPGVPQKAIKWLLMHHGPLRIRPMLDPNMWRWGFAMLRNCTNARYEQNKSRMVPLAEYSRDCMKELRQEINIHYDERTRGLLQLFRTQKQVDHASIDMAILDRFNVPYELLDRDGCIAVEPGLKPSGDKIAGGLRLVNDETGDCQIFTQKMKEEVEKLGVEFKFGVTIKELVRDENRIKHVKTDQGDMVADHYVLCLGSYSPLLAKSLGLRLPIYPVKGYSITFDVADDQGAPQSTIMDETYKVAMTRLGSRVRVAGTAELTGYNLDLRDGRRKTVEFVISDLFPNAGEARNNEFWCGLRPMTPDGTPLIGESPIDNLSLNTGHGTLGWTMACGSGRLLADMICKDTPDIAIEGLGLSRYS